ncbi:cell division protein FtsX [Falsirhodobacter sp. 20TX0035]|uniref:cell division protein FtsX n=1 Tax=Falsirhodobacter sp. 20TX0035 TaxID=3022019 RepID=UPI00232CF22B|nr:cell division protein FtsX [Falsirhodobacter sp. 20TX0035]MDB6452450.1 cell division protein FtsX [Falsirhodobacter sp. 20TX0035]
MSLGSVLRDLTRPDPGAERLVPPTGTGAWLTIFSAGVMAFLAVFALALSLAAGRLADRWSDALARTSTIRISAEAAQVQAQVDAVMAVLQSTPGIADARPLSDEEERALLAPWFGADLPLDTLPIPKLVEITEGGDGYDPEGLRQRLAAEAPGATLDDHARWRQPLAAAASRLRLLGWGSLILILATTGAVITLAANASLAANAPVLRVLRQIGAQDGYIARAFVRRFTLRTLGGSATGVLVALVAIWLTPSAQAAEGFLTGLGFTGAGWLLPWLLPPLCGAVAFAATRAAAFRKLAEMP